MVKNTSRQGPLWNALGSGMYAAVTFLTLIIVSRTCGPEAAGTFSLAFTTAQMLYIVGVFGAHTYHMTDYRGEYTLADYGRLRRLTGIVMLAGCMAAVLLLGFRGEKAGLTFALSAFMLVSAVAELWQSQFFRCNRLDLSGQSLFFRNLFSVAAFAVIMYRYRSMLYASVAAFAVNLLTTLFLGPLRMRRVLGAEAPRRSASLANLAKVCLPLFISMFLMMLLPSCGKYLLQYTATELTVGYYSMIVMPVQFINLLASFIFQPTLNGVAQCLSNGDSKGFQRILRKNTLLIVGMTLASTALAYLLGIPVLSWFYHAELQPFRRELTLAVFGGGLVALSTFGYYVLVMLRRQKFACYAYTAAAVLCVVVGMPLVRDLGILGGVLSFIVSYVLHCVAEAAIVIQKLRRMRHA